LAIQIELKLIHNDTEVYNLKRTTAIQRISDIFGKSIQKMLVPVESQTSILNINGFVGKPETAKKRNTEQYFFVNGRYMKHPYFYKAVLNAYEQIIKPDLHPSFFLFFEIAPERIDINIHPAKIQINFDDSQGIFQLLRAGIKQALGKYNVVPSIDFDREGYIEMPYSKGEANSYIEPDISSKKDYNPFEDETADSNFFTENFKNKKTIPDNWDALYTGFEKSDNKMTDGEEQKSLSNNVNSYSKLFQFKNKYVVTPVKSGLMFIHICRAHERILFESMLSIFGSEHIVSQKAMFPTEIQLSNEDFILLKNTFKTLKDLGFEISESKDDKVLINSSPAILSDVNPKSLIEAMLVQIKDDESVLADNIQENIAEILAKKASLNYAKPLAFEELHYLIDQLFSCRMPNFTKNGRKIIEIIKTDEISKLFG